jgi:hypothetical protein
VRVAGAVLCLLLALVCLGSFGAQVLVSVEPVVGRVIFAVIDLAGAIAWSGLGIRHWRKGRS